MQRILFICHDASRTGAPIGLLAFMRWLRANRSCELGTIVRTTGPLQDGFAELGPVLTLGSTLFHSTRLGRHIRERLPDSLSSEQGKVRRFFEAGRYELVYSNTATNGAILSALGGYGVPILTHVHELQYWLTRIGAENLAAVKAQTRRYVAASQAVRDNLVRNHGVAPEAIAVVYEHIRELPVVPSPEQKATARETLGIPADAFVIGGCGAEHWRKGRDVIPQLLIALRRITPARDFRFLWVGRSGSAEEEYALRYDLSSSGLADRFHTSGETADPLRVFPAFDAFALLSRDDPYPLACLEVAAMECPVVCFLDAGGIPEFIRDGCGLAVPYLDLSAMGEAFARLAETPAEARHYGSNARAKVTRENLPESTGPQLWGAMERCIATKPY
jgi:glycosyltransferase involved in cell wall biosynthesis